MADVLLGYELGSGKPVLIPLHHVVVTGVTQLSGKTTTLEALIDRANLRAIAFRTKRGESGFEDARTHPPFFRERADWQYVQGLLEATMRERMKFERSWIIRACKGARTLRDVQHNVERELQTAKGLSESVYTNLRAYLEIVLPEIEHTKFADRLELHEGVNVMDLVGLRDEVQSLIIAATLAAIYEDERDVVVVIPEAWKFCPEGRGNPVKREAERLIRQGASIRLYLWFDSQDMAGVDKALLKQVDNWILGRQREINEVEHTLSQVPVPRRQKPKPDEIMQLPIGHFYACYGDQVRKVYVRPRWLDESRAIEVAKGKRKVKDLFRLRETENMDEKDKQRIAQEIREQYEKEIRGLKDELAQMRRQSRVLAGDTVGPVEQSAKSIAERVREGELRDEVQDQDEPPERKRYDVAVSIAIPQLTLTERIVKVAATDDEPTGRMAKLIAEGFFDNRRSVNEVRNEFATRNWGKTSGADWNNAQRLGRKFAEMGFLREVDKGFVVVPEAKARIKRVRLEE